ncbi:acyltransferase family protein [Dictyobacter aurantiacus]|uniref:Acyltransferase n=1 Tax=Dictyobacter aurantiacus TaxID=1936993 RepID=A0A401ZK34_9CHLR|nr:acyltransferase [Dictyobacter aurantiacus]GCE07225.1 acyltransferase [Dictyobacter aurantiacus]
MSTLQTGTLEEQKAGQQKKTITALDGVRGCAILFVLIFHINRTTGDNLWDWHAYPLASSIATAGGTGVTLFFVLSGFLLFLPYAKALLTRGRWPLARTFYLRRALRILPAYYVSLLLLIALSAPSYLQPARRTDLLLFLTLFMDSSRSTFRALNGPYWTLAVEWQFYLLLPLLTLGMALLLRRVQIEHRLRAVTLCLCGVIAGGLIIRLVGSYFWGNPTATFLLPRPAIDVVLFFVYGQTGKYLEDFAVGMLCALLYVYATQPGPEAQPLAQRLRRLSLWLWSAGLGILLFSAIWHFQSDPRTPAWPLLSPIMPYFNWLSEMLLAIGYGMCMLAILAGPPALRRPFTWRPLRWLGLISFSLYIWHLPLIVFFQTHIQQPLFPHLNHYLVYLLYWLWAAMGIIPFCILSYNVVEKPAMRLGDRWRRSIEARQRAREQAQPQIARDD